MMQTTLLRMTTMMITETITKTIVLKIVAVEKTMMQTTLLRMTTMMITETIMETTMMRMTPATRTMSPKRAPVSALGIRRNCAAAMEYVEALRMKTIVLKIVLRQPRGSIARASSMHSWHHMHVVEPRHANDIKFFMCTVELLEQQFQFQ